MGRSLDSLSAIDGNTGNSFVVMVYMQRFGQAFKGLVRMELVLFFLRVDTKMMLTLGKSSRMLAQVAETLNVAHAGHR